MWFCETEIEKLEFHWPFFRKVTYSGFNTLNQKNCWNSTFDCTIFFLQNIKIKQIQKPRCEVLSNRNLCSFINFIGLCNLTGLNDLYSSISSKNFLIVVFRSSLVPKWPIVVPFCGMDHKKSNFSMIFDTLYVRGCWGQNTLLF